MADLFEIAASFATSLKSALDITNGLLQLDGSAKFKAKVMELQGVIVATQQNAMAAQAAQFALLQENRGLEEEVARLKAWDGEKQRYELQAVGSGAFAYVPKPGMLGAEPPHWLCTTCYQEGHKSIMQDQGRTIGKNDNTWRCGRCKGGFTANWARNPKTVAAARAVGGHKFEDSDD